MKRTELRRRTPLQSRTDIRRGAPLRAVSGHRRDVPASVRVLLRERAHGLCEACGGPGPDHAHHRKLRSQGGRHDLANLILIHGEPCHRLIHAHPERAYALGLMVHGWADPADVPVRLFVAVDGAA